MQTITTRKTKLEIPIPDGWHEVPFHIAFQLIARDDLKETDILSLLSGVDRETLRKETDLETITHFTNALLFLNSLPDDEGGMFPASIQHPEKDERIPMPRVSNGKFDLGNCSTGQVEDMRETLKKHNLKEDAAPIEVFEVYPKICAIYLQPILKPQKPDEPYDYQVAMEYVDTIEKIDFKTIYLMGNFFLWKLNGLVNGSQTAWQKHPSSLTKLKRALNAWGKRLASMLR